MPRYCWGQTSAARKQALGVFFGRSALQPEPLARFSQRLTKRLDLRPAWIPSGSPAGLLAHE